MTLSEIIFDRDVNGMPCTNDQRDWLIAEVERLWKDNATLIEGQTVYPPGDFTPWAITIEESASAAALEEAAGIVEGTINCDTPEICAVHCENYGCHTLRDIAAAIRAAKEKP